MSNGRRAVRPIRQLSLQQPTPRRQHIRRQRSAEDDKSLQIYANPIARGRLAVSGAEKPKVRVAWGDDRRGCDGDLERVEVVARQIPSRSRQTTSGRSTGKSYVVGGEKASILYSRQELAERLRLAWKHREENKSNIDIFLARGFTVEERCDSAMSMSTPVTPLATKELASGRYREKVAADWQRSDDQQLTDSREKATDVSGETSDGRLKDGSEEEAEEELDASEEPEAAATSDTTKSEEQGATEESTEHGEKNASDSNVEEKKRTRISIDCTNLHSQHRSTATLPSSKAESPTAVPTKTIGTDDFSSARQKRASFHSGTNRAFLVPMIENTVKVPAEANKCPAADKIILARSIETRCASASGDKFARQMTTDARSPTVIFDRSIALARSSSTISPEKARRTNSAPPQRRAGGGDAASASRVQVNIVIDAPGLAEVTNDKPTVCGQQDGKSAAERQEDGPAKISRPVRSAPLKKRSRSAKRRYLTSSGANGKDEAQDRCGGRARAYVDPRTTDVVTMVSLVSSADSDSDTENSPGDDKLINELRSKLPTTPIIKTSINPNPGVTRKPIKSVSFQRYSFDEDPVKETHPQTSTRTKDEKVTVGVQPARLNHFVVNGHHGEDAPSWRQQQNPPEDVGSPLAVSALLIQDLAEAVPETAPLTDREKRCLAVPIGDLHDDKKRKLLRTRSVPSRPTVPEQTSSNTPVEVKEQQRPSHLVAGSASPVDGPLLKAEQYVKEMLPAKDMPPREITLSTEPRFQTTKEKECWHLYRRMCDKGVCVSFDTVLRGMLTPTEYRLRQKELSQDL